MPGLILVAMILSFPSFSQETLRAYQGTDKGRPCFLYLHQEQKNEMGNYTVEVSTSYEHNGQGLGKVWIQFTEEPHSKMLLWEKTETGESLRVLLKQEEPVLETPQAFRIRWMHFDHLHDSTCNNLQKVNLE